MRRADVFWLLVLVVALLAGLSQERAEQHAQTAASTSERLLPAGLDAIVAVSIERGGEVYGVTRDAHGWRFGTPVTSTPVGHEHEHEHEHERAAFIHERLAMFAVATVERRFAPGDAGLAAYGIDERAPRIVVALRSGAAEPLAWRVGARTPDGFGQYLLDEQRDEVLVLPAYQVDHLERLLLPAS